MKFVERWRASVLRGFAAIGILTFIFGGTAESNAATLSQDGPDFVLEADGASRRDTLEILLRGRNITLEWRNESFASEPLNGLFRGSVERIFRQIARSSSFVAVYGEDAQSQPTIRRIIFLGPSQQPSPGLDAVATALAPPVPQVVQTAEEKLRVWETLRRNGISEQELAQRRAREKDWMIGRERALQNQLQRTAEAPLYPNGNNGENSSAGFPPFFFPPPDGSPDRHALQAQALTTQMAQRNLMGLYQALNAARP
jgi:hypothetical protein